MLEEVSASNEAPLVNRPPDDPLPWRWRYDRKPFFFQLLASVHRFFFFKSMSYCLMFIQLCHSFPSL